MKLRVFFHLCGLLENKSLFYSKKMSFQYFGWFNIIIFFKGNKQIHSKNMLIIMVLTEKGTAVLQN